MITPVVTILSILSVVLFLLAAPPYIIDTLRGRTKPERATWLIWSILGVIAFAAQLQLGATWSLLFTGLDTAGCVLAFLLSITYGVGGWTFLDKLGLGIAFLGVLLAVVSHQPILAITGVILADMSGTMLTIQKTFRDPDSETTISWLLVGTGALCGAFLVRSFNLNLLLYPLYLVIANYSIPLTQVIGRMYHMRSSKTA
jgi:hypothetical protein